MKKNTILTIAIFAASLGFAACSDDNKDSSKDTNPTDTSACTESSQLTCASETSKNVCNAGKIEAVACGENEICEDNTCKAKSDDTTECTDDSALTCASETSKNVCNQGKIEAQACGDNEVCENNTCKAKGDDTPECTDDSALQCASETSKNVCNAGKIEAQACGDNEICENNTCKPKGDDTPECTDDSALQCASETSKNVCNAGKIEAQACGDNEICENNTCKPKGDDKPECTDDSALQCASETSKNVCNAGKIEAQACGNNEICKDNTCKPKDDKPTKPVKGGDCTIDACDNNIPYYCVSGHYQVDEESSCGDKVCEVMDGKNAFCLEACTKEKETGKVCGQNQIEPYSAKAVCTKFEDGKLAMYYDESDDSSITRCDNGCDKGECINQKPEVITDDTGKDCDKSEYGYSCSGNNLQYCNYFNKIAAIKCSLCTYASDPKDAYCATNEGCTEGDVKNTCEEFDDNTDRLHVSKCTKAHDGKYYMFVDVQVKNCESGSCKEDGSCEAL